MEIKELIKICKKRGELEFLFQITKSIAESDSIGEGWSYCRKYEKSLFNCHLNCDGNNPNYIEYGSIKIYELYLIHIGEIKGRINAKN